LEYVDANRLADGPAYPIRGFMGRGRNQSVKTEVGDQRSEIGKSKKEALRGQAVA
jgi:hypothetical protein